MPRNAPGQPQDQVALFVFAGRAGDHNDLGMAGAQIVGAELSRRLDAATHTIGTPEPATNRAFRVELDAALPALRELQTQHDGAYRCGAVPVTAMPRYSAALATLPNVARHHPDALVVWFDAHGDLNTPHNTVTGYLGGLVLSAATGWWDSGLGAGLAPENIVLAGTRDLDAPERALVETGTIKLAAGSRILEDLDRFAADRPVYFHLDCDVLEPGIVPTDYQVPNGLTLADLAATAERLARNPLVGLEVAEFESSFTPTGEAAAATPVMDAISPLLTRL